MMQTAAVVEAAQPKIPAQHFHETQASTFSSGGKLKYADPRNLPSFPSSGLSSRGAAASAAATLGWSNQKSVEPWRPDKTSSASAAAVLAKNYKMSPSWEPASNSEGARAAVIAIGSAGAALKKSEESKLVKNTWGNSAAMQAFNASRETYVQPRNLSHSNSAATQAFHANQPQSMRNIVSLPSTRVDRSLIAAKDVMSDSKTGDVRSRQRSHTMPQRALPSVAMLASSNALNGATVAHRASMKKPTIGDAGAVSVTTMTRKMFTSHPPVKLEVDEKNNNDRLHQSAVEMAKKMYQQQQRRRDEASDDHQDLVEAHDSPYLNLHDAAYKQAQERLAKLQDEHYRSLEYQEYYGNEKSPRRRFSVINKLRRRASSEVGVGDWERSEKIRQEMSLFSSQLSKIDKEKRERDRDALLATAQRNVKARLQGMDEKVYSETGKVNPTMLTDWELKAQHAAQSRHDRRTEASKNKVNIGGGRFMDASEIDAIAAKRVQPVLDDIQEKAAAERERQAMMKLEEESKKAEVDRERIRDRELKDIQRKAREEDKQHEKARRLQEKQDEKTKKEEEKTARQEQKRLAKEEKKRKSMTEVAPQSQGYQSEEEENEDDEVESPHEATASGTEITADTVVESTEMASQRKSPEGSISPTSRVKVWIKSRFSRGKPFGDSGENQKRFVGGAALKEPESQRSRASLEHRASSMRDVALAGRDHDNESNDPNREVYGSRDVSPVSVSSENDQASNGRVSLEFPRPPTDNLSGSPARDSRFREMMDR